MEEVQGGAGLEPFDLLDSEGVVQQYLPGRAVGVVDDAGYGLAGGEGGEAEEADPVVLVDAVVVVGVAEGERQEALLLQVGLVDAGEAAGDDGRSPRRRGDKAACSRLLPSP